MNYKAYLLNTVVVIFIYFIDLKCSCYKKKVNNNKFPLRLSQTVIHQTEQQNRVIRDVIPPTKAYVELLIVCDFYCFLRHKQLLGTSNEKLAAKHIEAYYAMVVNLANLYLKQSFINDTELEIELFIKNYIILTTSDSSRFSTNKEFFMKIENSYKDNNKRQYINCDLALPEFNQWIINQIADDNEKFKFDISIVFTYANLRTTKTDILGLTVVGGGCLLGTNGIMIEDNGAFSSVKTVVHELAHNLGVLHDTEYTDENCTDEMNYIMATSTKSDNISNSFYFSQCSMKHIQENIVINKEYECVFDSVTQDDEFSKLTQFIPGQIYDATEQCKQVFGKKAKALDGKKPITKELFEDEMCTKLWCTIDGKTAQTSYPATMGTSCSNGKWCNNGVCTSNELAPTGTCLLSDDYDFCHRFKRKFGIRNTCLNFKTTRCCNFCGGSRIKHLANHTINNWLSKSTLKTVTFINTEKSVPCGDKYEWCNTTISSFIETISDFCKKLYLINNEIVQVICRKSCNLC